MLTVGGIYGIVQELEDEEDGGDLVVEIAEGIHVRVARRAVATVVKPDDEEDDEDEGDEATRTAAEDDEDGDTVDADAELVDDPRRPPPAKLRLRTKGNP